MKRKTKTTETVLKLEAIIAKLTDENRRLYSRAIYAEERMAEPKHTEQPKAEQIDLTAFDNVIQFRRAS